VGEGKGKRDLAQRWQRRKIEFAEKKRLELA
jgi:hypothetical protein